MTDDAAEHAERIAERIRATIRRYQTTFSENDRAGWIGLFTEDAVLEDPVGTHRCEGHVALGEFWDRIHASGHRSSVVPVTTPAVCGLEAAWAFEVHVDAGDTEQVISIIDVGQFSADGHIAHNRAFWDPTTVRVVLKPDSKPTSSNLPRCGSSFDRAVPGNHLRESKGDVMEIYSYRVGVFTPANAESSTDASLTSQPSDVTGFDVEALDGSIGKVDEATYEAGSSCLVVDTGFWIFGKKRMIPAGLVDRVDPDAEKVYVRMTKDQIKDTPDYDADRHRTDERGYHKEVGGYYEPNGF